MTMVVGVVVVVVYVGLREGRFAEIRERQEGRKCPRGSE